MKTRKPPKLPAGNPVAKQLNRFNKPATHRDRKNDYRRTPKHRPRDFGVFVCRGQEKLLAGDLYMRGRGVEPEVEHGSSSVSSGASSNALHLGARSGQ